MFIPGSRAIQFDLKSGYHAISLAKEVRKYFAFQVLDKTYVFNVLPFGLNIAPLIFVMLTRHLVKLLRTRKFGKVKGVNVLHYIDDFLLILAKS